MSASTTKTKGEFKKLFEAELCRYCKEDVPLYSAEEADKWLAFVVAIYVNGTHEMWATKGAKLRSVPEFCVIGWEEPLYTLILSRLYRSGMTVAQGVLAGIYTLASAEATSNSVRGPMRVGGVNDWGAWLDGSGYIVEMNSRLQTFERRINSLLLASADIGMNLAQYQQTLNEFTSEALKLHRESLVLALRRFLTEPAESWRAVNTAYNRIPPALSIAIAAGDLDEVLGPGEKDDLMKKMIKAAKEAYRAQGDPN